MSDSTMAWLVPLAPLVGCLICAVMSFAGDRKCAHLPAIVSLAIAALASLGLLFGGAAGADGSVTISGYRYLAIGTLTLDIALKIDTLALTLLTVVTCVSTLIAIYSRDYMKGDAGYARYFSVFCGFVFSMTMLVLSHNLLMMYAFWELVGTCSYLLIGFWFHKPSAAAAAFKAFLVNRIADCAFLLGILLLGYTIGQLPGASDGYYARLNFDHIFAAIPDLASQHPQMLGWIALLLMIGAIGKSAQFPFHVWLPDAMEGPTPVSALIHAATMVTAGVFLMARMSPMLVETPAVLSLVGWLGGITALIAAVMALYQHDLKRVLAYSTVSQLGYLFMALSAGAVTNLMVVAVAAAMFHLVTHAFFKALLFLSAGNVMHAMGDVIDMRRFGGLKTLMPRTNVLFLIGAAALAGLPPLAGFFSKDSILAVLADASSHSSYGNQFTILLVIGFFTAFLTAVYTSKAYYLTFHGDTFVPPEAEGHAHEACGLMLAPMGLLAIGALLAGVLLGPTHLLTDYLTKTPALHLEEVHPHAWWVLVASALVAISGVLVGRSSATAARQRGGNHSPSGLEVAGENRLYIDWAYGQFLVVPLEWVAKGLAYFDQRLVDPLVVRFAALPERLGRLGQRVQNGRVPTYTYVTVLGIAALALWIVSR